jgi:hypothetical protein
MARMPALYIPHGGGPSFFMTGERKQLFQQTEDFLRDIDQHLPAKPSAILIITAHWEARVPSFTSVSNASLIYDYYGFPPETYNDLKIKMTQPSEWRELSRAEVINTRIQNAGALKSGNLLSDFDILTKWMMYSEDETKTLIARLKMQKIEDAKLQVLAQNPALLGVGIPADDESEEGEEIGATPEGPSPQIAPPGQENIPQEPSGFESQQAPNTNIGGAPIPFPNSKDIQKYDMEINNYANEEDYESPDYDG